MQRIAHAALERGIDHLMLLNARLANKGGRDDARRVMIAIAAQILDRDLGVGQTGDD